jgi:guanylate kinase
MLLESANNMQYSISCTTRAPRGKEVDGRDYHFLTPDEFEKRSAQGDFLEEAIVHDNRYGTLRNTVESAMDAGADVLMDIDVQGADQVRTALAALEETSILKNALVDIFIAPPSIDELKKRLTGRGEDTDDVIQRRLANAEREMACSDQFQHIVVNDDLQTAFAELSTLVDAASQRLS